MRITDIRLHKLIGATVDGGWPSRRSSIAASMRRTANGT
jgi:hypothetical protein